MRARATAMLVLLMLPVLTNASAGARAAEPPESRHAGYYYPEPRSRETYEARARTLPESNRTARLGFIIGFTRQLLNKPYAPPFVMFAKGDEADKMIIVGLAGGYLDSIYRARAVLAMMTTIARTTPLFEDLRVEEAYTFFDLAKLLGFRQITISDGASFAHQITLQ